MVNINATFIWQIVNFLILVFILAKFAYKPILNMMEERKNKIASDLEAAEKAKESAENLKEEYQARISNAKQEAQVILDNARKTAQAAHDKIIADTKAEQEQVIAAAKDSIELEKKKAMDDIRSQVINLSMIAASKIVEQKLGSEEDKKMAGEIVDALINK